MINLQQMIDKLNEIKTSTNNGDIKIYFSDLSPLTKVRVFNLSRKIKDKVIILSDK